MGLRKTLILQASSHAQRDKKTGRSVLSSFPDVIVLCCWLHVVVLNEPRNTRCGAARRYYEKRLVNYRDRHSQR